MTKEQKENSVNKDKNQKSNLYGLMAEFEDAQRLLNAANETRSAGYQRFDAYSPFPVEGLPEAVGMRRTWISAIVLVGGILGALVGFSMQYYASVIDYPLNAGGKPYNSWPAFIPITFELTIIFAAFAAVLGMFALNGLPEPYHPVFNLPRFSHASRDAFFLGIEAEDPLFDLIETRDFLERLGAVEVNEVQK